jgi:geranylgeranyl pyrophosphate synthase
MLAAAVEVAHAYSLVHDDLPCMDDDDVRRGRPTVHRAFDVETATVAGVAMVPVAVVAIVDAADALQLDLATKRTLVTILMRASGAGGMIGGQLLDLLGEGRALSLMELERIHRGKTGALIAASAAAGGHAAMASPNQIAALERFGESVGLAFQITDDVLDVTATTEAMGKPAGRDLDLMKSTYVVQLGIEGARARATTLVQEGMLALDRAGILTADLEALANLVLDRRG